MLATITGLTCQCSTRTNFTTSPAASSTPPKERLSRDPRLERALLGALVWLSENQIQDREGRGSPAWDSTDTGDGARDTQKVSLPFRLSLEIPTARNFEVRNRIGEWPSEIHLLPHRFPLRGRGILVTQDHNLFANASILAPCYLFEDDRLPEGSRFVSRFRTRGLQHLDDYRRGSAWNFWYELPGADGREPRVGCVSIPMATVRAAGEFYLQDTDRRQFRETLKDLGISSADLGMPPTLFWALLRWQTSGRERLPREDWVEQCLRSDANPNGADALFNIPNDADDTSLMFVVQSLAHRAGESPSPDLGPLRQFSRFRDLDRPAEDGRDRWKGSDSGAFLTWLTGEEGNIFSPAHAGVLPLGVNNVDAVVNANAIHALSRAGLSHQPGFEEAIRLVNRCATERHWPEAALYYPHLLSFPYAASRAWREGGLQGSCLDEGMKAILADLLALQEEHARRHPGRKGAFPGGEDPSEDLATAMGLAALLNLGKSTAEAIGETERYREAVRLSVERLLRDQKQDLTGPRSRGEAPFPALPPPARWESGLFFGASFWDLAHWRSEAVSTAIAMEALAKYALAYDLDEEQKSRVPRRLILFQDEKGVIRLGTGS